MEAEAVAVGVLAGTPYEALQKIGQGGMGEVYLARHRASGRLVVAKVLRAELAARAHLVDRLRLEAQALASVNHANIVSVLEFGETADGLAFLSMERLEGSTLAEELRVEGRPPLARAVRDIAQVLSALSAAHAVGLVHRDVKPSNIFAHCDATEARIIKLLDFGIAKLIGGVRTGIRPLAAPTAPNVILGTPRYVSPEQANAMPIDARSDLYSVGVLLYRLVAGRGPFDEYSRDADVLAAHLGTVPLPPSRHISEALPRELDSVVLKAIQKSPADRFQSAGEFIAALEGVEAALDETTAWSAAPRCCDRCQVPHGRIIHGRRLDSPVPEVTAPLGSTQSTTPTLVLSTEGENALTLQDVAPVLRETAVSSTRTALRRWVAAQAPAPNAPPPSAPSHFRHLVLGVVFVAVVLVVVWVLVVVLG